jgi:glycosyltransferase involved in cell wall biosynthesis
MIRRHRAENTWNDKVSLFIALSNFSAKKLAEGGIDTEKIKTKPGFAFHQTQEGVRTNSDFALYVGRLSEEKGLRTVLRAWEKLKFPLWIVGDGPLRNEADALKIKNPAVKVLGEMPLESVTRIMAKARFLILPSEFYENFPLVLAEAFSVGLPVVAARIGALAELVYHERNGLLFEPGNSEILATLTTMLFQNDTLSNRLGSAARTTYEQLYTPVANLKRLREIYAMAMENAKA